MTKHVGSLVVTLLSGCSLLPQQQISCADTDVCGPIVAAPFVLGQPDPQTNWLVGGLSSPSAVAFVGGKLIVVDHGNNRVLLWNAFPTANRQVADIVLGQPDRATGGSISAQGAAGYSPSRVAATTGTLVVSSDLPSFSTTNSNYNRLSFWRPLPTNSNTLQNFTIAPGAAPAMPGALTFVVGSPLLVGSQLYLSDRGYNRVLIWSAVPTAVTDAATGVLGQPNLTSGSMAATSATTLSGPDGSPASDGTKLFVADTGNNRVLIWNALPTTSTAADVVLGQPDFTSNKVNQARTPGLATLSGPATVSVGGGHLAVADRGNNRVLLWNQVPTASGAAADLVLGQADAASTMANAGGASLATMSSPSSVATDGTRLAVADTKNHRVLLWQKWPTASSKPADLVLGQQSGTTITVNGAAVSERLLAAPTSLARSGPYFLAADRDGHRVLIWTKLPTSAADLPSVALGQTSLTGGQANAGGLSGATLNGPQAVATDGHVVAVADTGNHRVLLWSSIPDQSGRPADVVLGQPNMLTGSSNNGGAASGMNGPAGVAVADGRLYVADTGNHRLLIWRTLPTQNQQPPDAVLGQMSPMATMANMGAGPTATSLSGPLAVGVDGGRIFVSDNGNSRLLVWNSPAPDTGTAADLVLGEPSFTQNNCQGASLNVCSPYGLSFYSGRLFLTDPYFQRIDVWDPSPTTSSKVFDRIVPTANINPSGPNAGGLSAQSLANARGVLATEVGLYIADTDNGRIVALPPQ